MSDMSVYKIITDQKVAWGDMDAFGHVNNVIYYRYIESARIEYLNQLNILDLDINTVVASNSCKYLKPVFYPDHLRIGTKVVEIRNSAFRMEYTIWSEQQNSIVAVAEAVIVCVDKNTMQKVLIPSHIKEKILKIDPIA